MIRKILTVILSFAVMLGCVFGLSACNVKDGINGTNGVDGTDGKDGTDGVGVKTAYIDDNGDLILELTNGEKINCGNVRPEAGGYESDGLLYGEVKAGGETVGYSVTSVGTAAGSVIVIPSNYNGLPVVDIAAEAFADCSSVKSVTIPDSVQTIGERAFYGCSSLVNVSVGCGLVSCGEYAFGKCGNLERVNVGDLRNWCETNFANTSANPLYFASEFYIDGVLATSLNIPEGTEKIGDYAFYGCAGITSVTMGASVAFVGELAFAYCENLQSVVLGNGVATIGDEAFTDCMALETVTFGNKVNSIGSYAFNRCIALEEVTLPAAVRSIGDSAFIECYSLKTVNLNNGLESIGEAAFGGCSAIEKFVMPDSVTQIGYGMLMFAESGGFSGGYLYNNLSELVISNSLTEIPDFAFNGCNLKKVTVGSSVETIRYSAFYGCSNLKSIIIPRSLKRVESYAFYQCASLDTVYYMGTATEWATIRIGANGNSISSAAVYYYSEVQPADGGNYWHYSGGEPVVW